MDLFTEAAKELCEEVDEAENDMEQSDEGSGDTVSEKGEEYYERFPVEMFIFDTETTGCTGVPSWHECNRMIQYSIRSVRTKAAEAHYTIPKDPDWVLPTESTLFHAITRSKVMEEGIPMQRALDNIFAFVHENTLPGKKVCIIAHNCSFDRQIFLKELDFNLSRNHGEGLGWLWYDTLEACKRIHPQIADNSIPQLKPHKLKHLIEYFFPNSDDADDYHDASFDTRMLERIFTTFILPYEEKLFHSGWNELRERLAIVQKPFTEVRWLKGTDVSFQIYQIVNTDLMRDKNFASYACPYGFFSGKHVFIWACMKCRSDRSFERTPWENICRKVEILMRSLSSPPIFYDEVIMEMLEQVTLVPAIDLVYMQLFPSIPGTPLAYAPLECTKEEAEYLFKKWQIRSIHDFLAKWINKEPYQKVDWLQEIVLDLNTTTTKITIPEMKAIFQEEMLAKLSFQMTRSQKQKKENNERRKGINPIIPFPHKKADKQSYIRKQQEITEARKSNNAASRVVGVLRGASQ